MRSFQSAERDRDEAIWCFSQGNLLEIETATRTIVSTIDVYGGKSQLFYETPDRTVSLLDVHGNFWYAAYDRGLYKVNLRSRTIDNYDFRLNRNSVGIRSIAQGPGDSLWIGAEPDGLFLFDPAHATFLPPGFNRQVIAVLRARDSCLWITTEGTGLIAYRRSTGEVARFVHNASDPHSLNDNVTRVAYEDPAGRIWVGTGKGINLWNPAHASFNFYSNPHGGARRRARGGHPVPHRHRARLPRRRAAPAGPGEPGQRPVRPPARGRHARPGRADPRGRLGLATERQLELAIALVIGLAGLVGLWLVAVGGPVILALGALAIVAALAYTGGPFPYGYRALGEVFVFIFFGLVAVVGTAYLQALRLNPLFFLAAIPVGALVTAILVVNNLRDIPTDAAAGKRTLAVILGRRRTALEYALLLGVAFALPATLAAVGLSAGGGLRALAQGFPLVSLPLALPLMRTVRDFEEPGELNRVLKGTARLALVFGLLFGVGLAVAGLPLEGPAA